ncbi:MAG: ZIP family metal transporter [Leptolyngbyaceae cyanobacterium MO_188.B28]|nr:ZIP family metal transporter [Leptolyngbyaceae cyanobacterium MO_188.B28]
MEQLAQALPGDGIPNGVASSALASLGTGIGALPVLFTSQLSDRWRGLLFSVGGGVMLSAAAFSLLLPAVELSRQSTDLFFGLGEVAIALVLGAGLFYGLDKVLPEAELDRQAGGRQIWLFVLAIALHHFPEGLAVGLGAESTQNLSIAIGVALQNLPEGLMVALALRQLGYGAAISIGMATVSGWLEPVGGAVGVTLAGWGSAIAPMGMALAAGAMFFVVLHELLPTLNLNRLNSSGAMGLAVGVLLMGIVGLASTFAVGCLC